MTIKIEVQSTAVVVKSGVSARTGILGQIGGMPTAAKQLAAKMGLFESIGIGLGALTTRLSLQTMTRLVKL